MRLASVIVAIVAMATAARGDAKLVKQYAGRVVISPDPPPTIGTELRAYLEANATKDNTYEAIKGSPWEIHLVGVLSAEPKTSITLELVDKATVLHALDVAAKQRLVISSVKLTTAAGFEANKTYEVRVVAGKKVLAKARLRLRE